MSVNDTKKLEQNVMKKKMYIKNTWLDWLFNYIPDPLRKSVGGFKNKIGSLFKTNTPEQDVYRRGKELSQPETQNKIE